MIHSTENSPVSSLLDSLQSADHFDLDSLRQKLLSLHSRWIELEHTKSIYESELQRELRAKVDLCGGIPGCPDAETAVALIGDELLSARRAASLQFNRVFYMAPLTRRGFSGTHPAGGDRRIPENPVRIPAHKTL